MTRFITAGNGSSHPNGWPCRLMVSGQSEARRLITLIDPTHVLSIKSPERRYLGPRGFDEAHHLILDMDDVEDINAAGAPHPAHVERILDFVSTLPADAKLLIHCLGGTRLAPAAAIGILLGSLETSDALAAVVPAASDCPDPNRLLVSLFDTHWNLGGKLVAACEARFMPGLSGIARRRSSETDASADIG